MFDDSARLLALPIALCVIYFAYYVLIVDPDNQRKHLHRERTHPLIETGFKVTGGDGDTCRVQLQQYIISLNYLDGEWHFQVSEGVYYTVTTPDDMMANADRLRLHDHLI